MAEPAQQLNALKSEYQMLSDRLTEYEMESEEHQVVIDALKPLDGQRKCHRLVGGVLVERTVAEVIPALERNKTMVQNTSPLNYLCFFR